MADLNEHVAYLSQEIGPRPAGTEEEQRAALYISEQLSNEVNLPTTMEDFQCNPDSGLPKALLSGVAVVVTVLAVFLSVVVVPAIIIDVLCALLIAAEIFEKPIVSRFLNRGVSQNVVARYVPLRSTNRSSRRRKVVIVANYDSGKVRRDLSNGVISVLPIVYWVEFGALVLMPLLLLVRFFVSPEGSALIVFDVILGILAVLAVLPVVSFVLEKLADYNEGANCNASGVAVMMEVAARVMAARDLPDMEDPAIHGEDAAASAGLVPEGAELVYNTPSNTDELGSSMESAAHRLAAAKAAVAALSGKPVEETPADGQPSVEETPSAEVDSTEATSLPEKEEVPVEVAVEVAAPAAVPAAIPATAPSAEPSVPDWFKKGQEQAKKPKVEKPVQRSRYAAALEHAEEEIQARESTQKSAPDELSERMRGMRASVQAASAAAGATPTGVMPVMVPDEEPAPVSEPAPTSPEAPAAPASAVPAESLATPSSVPASFSVATPAAPAAVVSEAQSPAVPEVPAVASEVPTFVPSPAAASSALPHDDDPNVSVREGQRPLTGSAAPVPSVLPDLSTVPTPAEAADPSSSRRLVIPAVQDVPAGGEAPIGAHGRKRRAISLPKIGVSQELPRISMDDRLQAAPLSEERPVSDGRVRDLSAIVPSIADTPADPAATVAAPNIEASLRGSMPSLAQAQVDPALSGSISLAGSFTSMGATGAAAPIGDELLENATAEDLYVEDVDDTAYREQVTETGAMAGPGYVEMPKTRFGRLFGRKRRKEQAQESTPQEWLNVEDDFEAQQVGASRGSWESFRQDEAGDQTVAFTPDYFDQAFSEEEEFGYEAPRSRRRFEGGSFSLDEGEDTALDGSAEPVSPFAEGLPADFVFENDGAFDQIEQFHSQRVDIEVWFVALGAELAGNGGMRAFMDAHASELKGSIIIDLEAMGDGTLSLIDKEGTYLSKKASSRMKRLVKKAGQAVGLAVPSETMEWRDSSAAYAMKHGQQAMHLAGMSGKKPAFFAQADDVIENIDADQLALNSDFVMELLKHI